MNKSQPIEKRFWSKALITANPDKCWIWMGGRKRGDYGAFSIEDVQYGAHRVAWMLTHGEIPEGLMVCHRCDNPPCVNPNHLFLGNATDNMQDQKRKGRNPWSNKTHCVKGHPFSPENTTINKRGDRACKTCKKEALVKWLTSNGKHYKRPMVICRECKREMPHKARGLCHACNSRLKRHNYYMRA